MILFDEWFLPDGERHLQQWMTQRNQRRDTRLTYQLDKYNVALRCCPPDRRRTAVDVGAHVGLFSYWMAEDFQSLHAFEPKAEHRACWNINLMGRRGNTTLHPLALGEAYGSGTLMTGPSSSGDTYLVPGQTGATPIATLDSFGLTEVDFLKIDCEGYELFVLRGGLATITRWRPVILVEQKFRHARRYGVSDTAAIPFLRGLGYRVEQELIGDYIMVPPGD